MENIPRGCVRIPARMRLRMKMKMMNQPRKNRQKLQRRQRRRPMMKIPAMKTQRQRPMMKIPAMKPQRQRPMEDATGEFELESLNSAGSDGQNAFGGDTQSGCVMVDAILP